jgi:DNA-binding transcriptional LysR family regulator
MDWDKLRIFHAAAQAGSFTKAGESLGLSQSAVSRQVGALEQDLGVPLFHRHARGLILTEQGDLLYRTAHDVFSRLEAVQTRLTDSREKPGGVLRITTTVGLGSTWLTRRLNEFLDLYPDLRVELLLELEELDLSMREADVALWLHQPVKPDLIQRRLFTVHYHLYASPAYLKHHGTPTSLEDLDRHRIITFGIPVPSHLKNLNWLETAGRPPDEPRKPVLTINNVSAIRSAVARGIGIASLPDYMWESEPDLVQVLPEAQVPSFSSYFVYPQEMKDSAKVNAFRDFLLAKSREWAY